MLLKTADWCGSSTDPPSTIVSVTITMQVHYQKSNNAHVCMCMGVCVRTCTREGRALNWCCIRFKACGICNCITAQAFPNNLKDQELSSSESGSLQDCLNLNMKTLSLFRTPGTTYPVTGHLIPEDLKLHYVQLYKLLLVTLVHLRIW